jgi:hypothetical protein
MKINDLTELPDKLLRVLREVLKTGYGEIVIKIANHKIDVIEKKESIKVGKNNL